MFNLYYIQYNLNTVIVLLPIGMSLSPFEAYSFSIYKLTAKINKKNTLKFLIQKFTVFVKLKICPYYDEIDFRDETLKNIKRFVVYKWVSTTSK